MFALVKSENLAAFLTMLVALMLVLVPLGVFGGLAFREALDLYSQITSREGGAALALHDIEESLKLAFPEASIDFHAYFEQILRRVIENLGSIFSGLAQTIVGVFLGLLGFYYFLRDGERLSRTLVSMSPLPDKYDKEISERLYSAVNSVVKGTLIIAIIQGILSGIGFWIFGVPNPALWGSLAAIAALIPGIGTAIVLAPAIAYLFISGSMAAGIGLLIWGVTAVGLIDNVLGPTLIGRGVKIHSFIILISVLGGLQFFGPLGFLLGPIVLSLLFACGEIYNHFVKEDTAPEKASAQ